MTKLFQDTLTQHNNDMNTVINYLKQASTWRGIITVVAAFGVAISPNLAEAIVVSGIGLVGLVEVIRNERGE